MRTKSTRVARAVSFTIVILISGILYVSCIFNIVNYAPSHSNIPFACISPCMDLSEEMQ